MKRDKFANSPRTIEDPRFDRTITLREAYRVMVRFAEEYHSRGDMPVSIFLYTYACEGKSGVTADPAAPDDFLRAVDEVVGGRGAG